MSKTKSNVHPGHYKVAGRGRQGEDVIHDRQKTLLAASDATHEHQAPYSAHASAYAWQLCDVEALELPRKASPKKSRVSRVALVARRSPARNATRAR